MSNAQTTAYRLRWLLLVIALLCWLLGIFYLMNVSWPNWKIVPFARGDEHPDNRIGWGLLGVMGWTCNPEWAYWCVFSAYLGVFLLTQWFFLCPRGKRRLSVSETGRPMGVSVAIAALMAGLLSVGLLATIMQLAGKWEGFAFDMPHHEGGPDGRPLAPLLALAAAWGIWIVVFYVYFRQRDHFTWAGKILRGLIGGSILELLVAGPTQAMTSGKYEECYCTRGSYTGLVLGGTVLFWCFGPGIALLFIREKQRRQQLAGRICLGCGYDLRASTERCPECGLPIPPIAGSGTAPGAGQNPPTHSA